METIFLGTGGYHPNERRHTAGLLVPELGMAFDAGTGFFRVAPLLVHDRLDIFLTHAHLDHIVGLTYLLPPMMTGKLTKVRVLGTSTTLQAVREHLFADPVFPVLPDFEFITLGADPVTTWSGATVSSCSLQHPGGSLGYRLEFNGRRLVYITDTTVDGSYTDFVRDAQVLVHECYFPDDMQEWATKTGHSWTTPVAELAREAAVDRLYLTHIDPLRPDDDPVEIAVARAIFPKTDYAEDLLRIEV